MTTASNIGDEIRELYNEGLRDVGRVCKSQAVQFRRLGIRAHADGQIVTAFYFFGAAEAIGQVGEVFANR